MTDVCVRLRIDILIDLEYYRVAGSQLDNMPIRPSEPPQVHCIDLRSFRFGNGILETD